MACVLSPITVVKKRHPPKPPSRGGFFTIHLDMSENEVDAEVDTTTDFPDLSPAQLGLHPTHL